MHGRYPNGRYGRRNRRSKRERVSAGTGSTGLLEKEVPDVPEEAGTWRLPRDAPPPDVQKLSSADFIRHFRDGGPQEIVSDTLPDVDVGWIVPGNPEGTVITAALALCKFRFGDDVTLDSVISHPMSQRGFGYLVTLALADGTVLGSCLSRQIGYFDKDLTRLLQALREKQHWSDVGWKISTQTLGAENPLEGPDDLWRCELFPCKVMWNHDGDRYRRDLKYLNKVLGEEKLWKLADVKENREPGMFQLHWKVARANFTIYPEHITAVTVLLDARSQRRLRKAKLAMQEMLKAQAEAAVPASLDGNATLKELLQDSASAEPSDLDDAEDENEGKGDELWDLGEGS